MSTVSFGNPVTLDALFARSGQPSPDTVQFRIQKPDGSIVLMPGTAGAHADQWEVDLGVPDEIGKYEWQAIGTAGSTQTEAIYGILEVIAPAVADSPPPASVPPGPVLGPCTPWITGDDVAACTRVAYSSNPAVFDTVAYEAFMALFEVSGRQFTGLCEREVRPCANECACWLTGPISYGMGPWFWTTAAWGGGWGGGGAWANERGDRFGCKPMSKVNLAGYPVREISQVLIDGAALPEYDPITGARNWRLDKWRYLVRMDTPAIPPGTTATPNLWPGCFAAGTLVLTARGLLPIEDVEVGDRVLTHRNRWREVTWSGLTRYSNTVSVMGRGGSVTCTPDHPFWTANVLARPGKGTRGWLPEDQGWVEAADLEGSAWSTPSRVESLPIPMPFENVPANFWSFVGRWVGDGWTDSTNRVTICCGMHERDELIQLLASTGWKWRESGGEKDGPHAAARFRFKSALLAAWLREQFGTSAHDKRIPAWLLGAREDIRRDFLEGYVSADGWRGNASNGRGRPYTSVHTVSRVLALGTRLLAATLGYAPVVYEGHAGSDPRSTTYKINWPETLPGEPWSQARANGSHLLGRVKSVAHGRTLIPVYDLTVEEDHSFVADGVVVHNCQNMSHDPDQPGTFSVTYRWGVDPPELGRQAAVEIANQLWLACNGEDCVVPAGAIRVERQGITVERGLLANWADPSKPVGLVQTDLFLQAYWTGERSGRRSAVWTPDRQPFARRVGVPGQSS